MLADFAPLIVENNHFIFYLPLSPFKVIRSVTCFLSRISKIASVCLKGAYTKWASSWPFWVLIGTIYAIQFAYSAHKARKRYYELVEQLKRIAYNRVTCSKCKNEMPLGQYAFCPFCYNTLENGILS